MARAFINHLAKLTTALAIWSTAGTMAVGQTTDWKEGTLGYLSHYIGTDDYESVLQDETVSFELERLLGRDLYLLHERLNAHPPVGFSGTCLALIGNAIRRGGDKMAYLSVCPRDGKIEVALGSGGHVDVYASTNTYHHLNAGLRQWISHYQTIASRGTEAPSHVTLISR